jgi:hypothetical protein
MSFRVTHRSSSPGAQRDVDEPAGQFHAGVVPVGLGDLRQGGDERRGHDVIRDRVARVQCLGQLAPVGETRI